MIDYELHNRAIENKDWITILLVFCLILIVFTKTVFENRFNDFVKLLITDKYIRIYKENSNFTNWFTMLIFLFQILTLGLFFQYLLNYFKITEKTDYIVYIQIITFLSFFILSKYLIEKIIATAFKIESFMEQFNMIKLHYRAYTVMFLMPITTVLFYNAAPIPVLMYVLSGILIAINVVIYLKSIKIFQKLIFGKLFYFILYLCTLEIAPYYFIYYWFKSR
ncbi:DUF4271 domain-containing protein [Flavobacterium branchiophilum]|uniref:DUF4271 domain-containing protein n=2 Tax=Flavobacterium branchiophilum TaxID=55197 RepID=G2Z622_FLABF|nr:DUF4271 domain-containing protein [Flavobacterium branchiophilum]PDS24519.1 DUF4271 domain-containing protein [Flavobacterium branchiophilum]CCB68786.1 Probable transmembrane protein of unknown function [Flavobacterium branchiophilum FL-15]